MNFNTIVYRSFRILLLPLAILYGAAVIIRNYLFDKKIIHSASFNFPLICVGNIAAGGTGKSPMVEYILSLLHERYKVATVSRGYKRKTKGYILADATTTALDIGDEPMQFHTRFPKVPVAVGEERLVAIPQLLHDHPELEVIILDDAFQHRQIKPGFNILLTEYGDLYVHDFFLPTGDLRDAKSSAKRADIIIVTKCPSTLRADEAEKIKKQLQPNNGQQVFFSSIEYGIPYHITTNERKSFNPDEEVLLVCGIANPRPLKEYLTNQIHTYYQKTYSDHHIFSIDDINDMRNKLKQITTADKRIITTEKDKMRLLKYQAELADWPFYVLPMEHKILFEGKSVFENMLHNFISQFKKLHESA
jgi:tetraacyldisaccharide 4'-kinase